MAQSRGLSANEQAIGAEAMWRGQLTSHGPARRTWDAGDGLRDWRATYVEDAGRSRKGAGDQEEWHFLLFFIFSTSCKEHHGALGGI